MIIIRGYSYLYFFDIQLMQLNPPFLMVFSFDLALLPRFISVPSYGRCEEHEARVSCLDAYEISSFMLYFGDSLRVFLM